MKQIVTGSVTRTAKAQELLKKSGIASKSRKITERAEGCIHLLEVSDSDAQAAVVILRNAGLIR